MDANTKALRIRKSFDEKYIRICVENLSTDYVSLKMHLLLLSNISYCNRMFSYCNKW